MSFTLCFVIILSSGYGFTKRAAMDETAIQSAHKGFVPRIGGVAIYISILGFVPLSTFGFIPLSVVFEFGISSIVLLTLSAIPVFVVGLAEDLGFPMAPKRRLLAAVASSSIVILIFDAWITNIGVIGIDIILSIAPLGIGFTLFAAAGVVNAFNLIDGLNGLSAYVTISTAIALSIIAFESGNIEAALFLTLLIATTLGFFIFNFPFGKIFLGDAGAYVLGHLLVWSAILMVKQDELINAFAILLIFFWPVADTGLAIWRRWKLGNPADRPDRLHFHQLAMRFLEIRFFGRKRRNIANPIATLVLMPLISVPQVLGVLFWRDFSASVFNIIFMFLLFVGTYLVGINFAKRSRAKNRDE